MARTDVAVHPEVPVEELNLKELREAPCHSAAARKRDGSNTRTPFLPTLGLLPISVMSVRSMGGCVATHLMAFRGYWHEGLPEDASAGKTRWRFVRGGP